MNSKLLLFLSLLSALTMMIGCNVHQTGNETGTIVSNLKTTRLRMYGFKKTKSGVIWLSCPETVEQALDELEAVHKIEIILERDEFLVTYDATKANDETLLETVKRSGFTAEVIPDPPRQL